MASLLRENGRTFAVDVMVPQVGRKRIRLGAVPRREGQRFQRHIESIADAVRMSARLHPEDEQWLRSLTPDVFERVERTGLLDGAGVAARLFTLDDWRRRWLEDLELQRAERTLELYGNSCALFAEFLERPRVLGSIQRDEAASWVSSLVARGLAPATVRQHVRHLKACFNAAKARDLIDRNPFDRIQSGSVAAERRRFVTVADALAIMAALPSQQYQLVFALARFAGFRACSETHALRWADVDLDAGRMFVDAQKTGKRRQVPIVPELAELLRAAQASYDPSSTVVTISKNNVHRTTRQAIERANVEPWQDLFQTLRRSFRTEMEDRFPSHVVNAWCGHSGQVAERHYLMPLESHFEAASRSTMRSTLGRNEAVSRETTNNRASVSAECNMLPHGTLRNSPARIRTGDQAIMSRLL